MWKDRRTRTRGEGVIKEQILKQQIWGVCLEPWSPLTWKDMAHKRSLYWLCWSADLITWYVPLPLIFWFYCIFCCLLFWFPPRNFDLNTLLPYMSIHSSAWIEKRKEIKNDDEMGTNSNRKMQIWSFD